MKPQPKPTIIDTVEDLCTWDRLIILGWVAAYTMIGVEIIKAIFT